MWTILNSEHSRINCGYVCKIVNVSQCEMIFSQFFSFSIAIKPEFYDLTPWHNVYDLETFSGCYHFLKEKSLNSDDSQIFTPDICGFVLW